MGWEFDILNGIQSVFQSDLMDQIMPAVTALGNGGIFWIAAGLVFTLYKKTRTFGICILTALVFEVLSCNVILKPLVARPRPFTSDPARILLIPRPEDYSFPSGHTSNAFLGAHMAYKEFKDRSPILAYSGYAIAAFVAGSRLYNNRHWVADVVAGAGFGILSVELSYLIYFPIRNAIARRINRNVKNCPIVAAPVFSSNMAGFYLTYQF